MLRSILLALVPKTATNALSVAIEVVPKAINTLFHATATNSAVVYFPLKISAPPNASTFISSPKVLGVMRPCLTASWLKQLSTN